MAELLRIANCDIDCREGDVVFLHGLGGDALATWTHVNGSFWPQWLGSDLPKIGIWAVSYPAQGTKWRGAGVSILDRAPNVVDLLIQNGIGERPLILVTHSLGGLVAKAALRHCSDSSNSRANGLGKAIAGFVFLATPHTGSSAADWIERAKSILRTTELMNELRNGAPLLRNLDEWFRNAIARSRIPVCVYREGKPTGGVVIVDEMSGDPKLPGVTAIVLDANHIEICKPASKDEHVYVGVRNFVADAVRLRLDLNRRGPQKMELQVVPDAPQTESQKAGSPPPDGQNRAHPSSAGPDAEAAAAVAVWHLIDNIKKSRKEWDWETTSRLSDDLNVLFRASASSWSGLLRKEVALVLAEEEQRRVNRSAVADSKAAVDLTRLKKLISQAKDGTTR